MENCIFCKIVAGTLKSSIIWQNEQVLAINDIAPKAPVHVLILPKTHYATMLQVQDGKVAQSMFVAVQEINSLVAAQYAGFNLLCNNGRSAGQSVEHLHWHFLAGKNIYAGGLSF